MANENLVEKALKILGRKSENARLLVRQTILEEKIGIKKVDAAVEQYLLRWNDTTRPGLLALACEAAGGNSEEATPLQIALQFIDATMDIHDDIIDESIVKKNIKTIYGKLGKGSALLIGDVFMVKGFYYLHRALENLQGEKKSLIMDEIKGFLSEVVDAHISELPLKAKKWKIKPKTYLQILTKKAADIKGRMRVGAIYGGGYQREIDALSKYGRNIGILLAVRAEFVDVFEPDELIHRTKNECLPLPVLYALQSDKYNNRIQEILLKDTISEKDCNELVEVIYETTELSLLKQYLEKLSKEADHALNILPNTNAKSNLRLIIAALLEDL